MFKRRARLREARRAVAVAAAENPSFGEDRVRAVVLEIHRKLEAARAARDPGMLEPYLSRALVDEIRDAWRERNPAFASPDLDNPAVRVVGLVNAPGEARDRCVVEVTFHGGVSLFTGEGRSLRSRELWTLVRAGGRWRLGAIDTEKAGGRLSHELIAEEAGHPSVAADAAFEVAADDRVAGAEGVGALTSVSDPREVLADLAMLDARFDWHVVEQAIGRIVDAWHAAARGGAASDLESMCSERAARALLAPDDDGRLVMRSLESVAAAPVAVHRRRRVRLTVRVTLRGRVAVRASWRKYGRVTRGSLRRASELTAIWTLAADDDGPGGWRLDFVEPGWL
jgi:hypothetical protein